MSSLISTRTNFTFITFKDNYGVFMKNDVTPIPAIKQQCPNANKRMSCISQLSALPALFGKAQKPSGFEFVSRAEMQKYYVFQRLNGQEMEHNQVTVPTPRQDHLVKAKDRQNTAPPHLRLSLSLLLCVCVHRCVGVCMHVGDSDTERQRDTDGQSTLTHTLMTSDCSLRDYQGWSWRPS